MSSTGQYSWYCPVPNRPFGFFTKGWPPEALFGKLENDNLRPLDLASGDRIPHKFDGQATTGQTPQTNSICRRSREDGFRRGPEAGRKISNQTNTTEGRPVYQSDLLGPQERRVPAPCSQSEAIELLVSEVQIQDGGCKSSSGPN